MSWTLRTIFGACLCLLLMTGGLAIAETQDSVTPIEVHIAQVSGPRVTIDRGSTSGIAVGDVARFEDAAGVLMEGAVASVKTDSARIEMNDLSEGMILWVGQRGEVLVPSKRARADGTASAADDKPEHGPWPEPVGPWAPGRPLLAPMTSPQPEERDQDIRGRFYTRYQYADDREGSGRRYQRFWSGLDLELTNPFERGGQFRFRGDYSYRDYLKGVSSDDDSDARLQRFSYRHGTAIDDPARIEVGRFLHSEFSAFGLLDGVEYVRRLEDGSRVGFSLGMQPTRTDELTTAEDVASSVFYRWVADEDLNLGAGYQKTWHKGKADRDLVVGTLNWTLAERTYLRAAAKVDYQDGNTVHGSKGFQLSDLHVSLDHRFEQSAGIGLYASYADWPELLRDEFPLVLQETIANQQVSRLGLRGWKQVAHGIRLNGRVGGWQDNDHSGGSAELRCSLRDVLYEGGEFSLAIFDTEGAFSSGIGARALLTHWFDETTLRLGYETTRYEQAGFTGDQQALMHHLWRASLDTRLARDLDLSLNVDQRFGDEQDAFSAMLRLQWRF